MVVSHGGGYRRGWGALGKVGERGEKLQQERGAVLVMGVSGWGCVLEGGVRKERGKKWK